MDTSEIVGNSPSSYRIHPPMLAGGLLLGTLILHSLFEYGDVRAHQVLGLLLVAVGTLVCAFAAALFQARDTTRKPWGEPSQFVVERPYTFTRNPMYVGVVAALFGFAIFFGSIVMLLAPVVFFVVIDRLVIPGEEASMERMFGQRYLDYKTRVRRWL